uniref:Uncharacterized protein n=1 Tax=Anguilla anguilla TaxID=7936 RepID=A0A0E9UFF9_ANGAN
MTNTFHNVIITSSSLVRKCMFMHQLFVVFEMC